MRLMRETERTLRFHSSREKPREAVLSRHTAKIVSFRNSRETPPKNYIKMSVTAKREEFRLYLERCGVMDALTKILVSLYEETEKPPDALDYIRKNLGGIVDNTSEIDNLKKELEESKAKIAELKSKLMKYEQTKDEVMAE